jgi:hypothetical protein
MFWEQKQIYIHTCIMVLALCMHRVLPHALAKQHTRPTCEQSSSSRSMHAGAQLASAAASCSASLAAAEGQGVVGHHSMCAHIHSLNGGMSSPKGAGTRHRARSASGRAGWCARGRRPLRCRSSRTAASG